MILGVPTLNRYDLLGKLIASAEAGRLKPDQYLIVDNGGRFGAEAPNMPGVAAALARGAWIDVLRPGKNLGVAASWNAILDWAEPEPAIISNDDVELGEDALETLDRAIKAGHDFVIAEGPPNANGWCLFAQTARCMKLVGPYDEHFFPAYYEDRDYERRLLLAGIAPHREPATLRHEGWATMKADPSNAISDGQQRCAEYFRRKWGGAGGAPELFLEPFNGGGFEFEPRTNLRQTGWKQYAPTTTTTTTTTMRWDVINHIAKAIGVNTYLEIGVAGGENMRRVNIGAKAGVDPNPTIDGVKAAGAFFPCESDKFFESLGNERWDIVFIDGLHHADQAYRDIMNAARVARAVVVHDSNPSTEELQRIPYAGGDWTGDVWKAIARIRFEGVHLVRTIDTDFGVAVVIPNRGGGIGADLPRETWGDLQAHRQELLGLIPVSEWATWFEEVLGSGGK